MILRNGILAAGNMLVDHVHQLDHWPLPGWLAEIIQSERAPGGAPLNVLLTLAHMSTDLPLAALGLLGEDDDGDYLLHLLQQHRVDHHLVQRTTQATTAMTQVMTTPDGQRTFFHALGANRLLDLDAFSSATTTHKIFHLGYLLLLDSLDQPDDEFGTRSARLLAQMQQRGYQTSLDLVSRRGDPRYQTQVLPALRWLDYLVINELEAGELLSLPLRTAHGEIDITGMYTAATQLLAMGIRQRVVIHCPEGACAIEQQSAPLWHPAWPLATEKIINSVGAGDAFCAGVLYASHQGWPLQQTLALAHSCAYFNLLQANAIDGAQPLTVLQAFIASQA